MHLLERYALDASAKIDRAHIYEKFFPLAVNKYVTIQPFSKYNSKNYSYWNEVLFILKPILDRAGITIVQIGGPNEPALEGVYHTQGQTNIGQVAYIIKNSLLHLGADSFAAHIAGHFEKKIVALYSNNFVECVRPFWGNPDDQILIIPNGNGQKPSFSAEENPKTIDSINPELIAESVCNLLDLDFDFPFETIYKGAFYTQPKMLEIVPDVAVNITNLQVQNIIVRMDFLFNEDVLINQLRISNCTIVTDKPINLDLLKQFKDKIQQIVYIVTKDNHPKFVESLQKMGFNLGLISTLSEEELTPFKLNYLDIGLIHRKDVPHSLKESPLKDHDPKKLYYRSNKITLGRQKIYTSKGAWIQDIPSSTASPSFISIHDIPDFYEELDYFLIAKIKD